MIWQALTDRGLLFLTALQKLKVLDLSYTGEFAFRRLELSGLQTLKQLKVSLFRSFSILNI